MKPSILFDMDGTLVNSRETIATYFMEALEQCRIPHAVNRETIAGHIDLPFSGINETLALGMNEKVFARFLEAYRSLYLLDPVKGSSLYSGVPEVLERLKSEGFVLGLATGKRIDVARKVMAGLDLDHYFDRIQGWETHLKEKPEPDILLEALHHMKGDVKGAIMVGDTRVDIEAAQKCGMKTVACLYGFSDRASFDGVVPDTWLETINNLPKQLEDPS